MLTSIARVIVSASLASLVCAAAACSAPPDEEPTGDTALELREKDLPTTRDICTACGCVADNGFGCNCGMPPRPSKLECIRNGGPDKVRLPSRAPLSVGAAGAALDRAE